jgi:glycosyltransferase involved in cell wall biosynthesis
MNGVDFGQMADRVFAGSSLRVPWLAKLIDQLKPDVLHSFTIQQASYLTMAAKSLCQLPFPSWIVSNWGIDIHFYSPLAFHREAITAVLSECDYYFAECWRDVELARLLGFAGTVLDVLPIGGGFELNRFRRLRVPGPTSSRRSIMVKGYQDLVGRGLVALRAIREVADVLQDYRVIVYSAKQDMRIAAELLSHETGLDVEVPPFLPYEVLMRYHGRARISIGLSASDALSTSSLEAMIMGAFPIQSKTSCLDEWVSDGETALLVPPEDPTAVAAALRRAVMDDRLVDQAQTTNDSIVSDRLDASVVNPRLLRMYERAYESHIGSGIAMINSAAETTDE